jgi:ribosomal-protein-alanine acetyltransferase
MSTPFADARSATLDVSWRPMREADLDAVALLESQSHAAPWSEGNFRDALAAGYSTIVGDAGGMVVAYGVLLLAPGEAQLLNLTVAPHARRQGLARALLAHFLDTAVELGAEQCFLEVRVSNLAATALYEQAGFVPVARRAGYYPPPREGAPREDALVLRRALSAG